MSTAMPHNMLDHVRMFTKIVMYDKRDKLGGDIIANLSIHFFTINNLYHHLVTVIECSMHHG